jgi:hypothetical protein
MVVLPTGVWQTLPDGDRYISRVSSRCWASISSGGGGGGKRGANSMALANGEMRLSGDNALLRMRYCRRINGLLRKIPAQET